MKAIRLGAMLLHLAAVSSQNQGCHPGVDMMILIDRSRSINYDDWRYEVMPFVQELGKSFMNAATPDSARRIGVAVFPANGENNGANDYSGPAEVRISLSSNALNTFVQMTEDGKNKRKDKEAKKSLRFPSSGWTYTSLWTAFIQARRELFDESPAAYRDYKKVVVLITDGAPERNKNGGPSFRSRPTYLTALYAKELKDLGATILGVGFGKNFNKPFDECEPLCDGEPQHMARLAIWTLLPSFELITTFIRTRCVPPHRTTLALATSVHGLRAQS
jgi:hypothetical protein